LAANAPVDCEPLSPLAPLQPPDALQEVALVLDQASMVEVPDFTLLGVAVSVTIGALPATVTVSDFEADPPAPVQVTTYTVVLVRTGVCQTEWVGTSPCQLPTVATQAVALADVQVRVDLPPLLMVVGVPVNVSVGAAAASAVLISLAASELSAANASIDLNANGSLDRRP
jgi:hypothetical protein